MAKNHFVLQSYIASLILAMKLSSSAWTTHLTNVKWQMLNDPKADIDRRISSYVLKPEFTPPVQDKMASISKLMIPKITDQREMIYSFWCLMKGAFWILWAN